MGYNGGTNKRGYYRRFNNMQSKSAYKSGEKILQNSILCSLGLVALAGKAVMDMAENPNIPAEVTVFNRIKDHKLMKKL